MSTGYALFTDTLSIYGTANAKYTIYNLLYELNGGTNPENVVYEFTIIDKIPLPIPSKPNYRFSGWYQTPDLTGTRVTTTEGLNGDTTLYAKWTVKPEGREEFQQDGLIVFTGENYIDTDMYLYSEENIHRNFIISFNIEEVDPTNPRHATIVNAMDESHDPYNGHNIKVNANGSLYLNTNSNTSSTGDITIPSTVKNVRIVRIRDRLYYSFDNGEFRFINNYEGFTDYFDVPLSFGASRDENRELYRFFKGAISDLYAAFLDDDVTLADLNEEEEQPHELKTVYAHEGEYVFNGTSDYIDTGLNLFSSENITKDFEISFNIDSIADGNSNQNTLVNMKNEGINTYPGFVYRLYLAGTLKLEGKGGTGGGASNKWSEVQSVKIARKSGKIYITINNGIEKEAFDYSSFTKYFDVPLTIGASLDKNGNPFRFFKGTLSDIVVKVKD